jgi:flagellar biosynthesis/type III secretory pathway protein FliH
MKNQTAVEWIVSKLSITFQTMYSEEIEQAKEMQKEQIIRARQDGLDNGFSNGSWDSNLYYNETYGDK